MHLERSGIEISSYWTNGLTFETHDYSQKFGSLKTSRLKSLYRRLSSQTANLIIPEREIDAFEIASLSLGRPFDLSETCEYILRQKVSRLEWIEQELIRRALSK